MGQHGPKHLVYKSSNFCHCLGSDMTLEFLFGVVECLFYRNTLYIPPMPQNILKGCGVPGGVCNPSPGKWHLQGWGKRKSKQTRQGRVCRPFRRRSARALTTKVGREKPLQLKALSTIQEAVGSPFPLQGPPFPLRGYRGPLRRHPFPLKASFDCLFLG